MIEETSSKKISRDTLEAVFQSQEKLRKHLDTLIKEDRCLKDDEERNLFFRELTYSTLGFGTEHYFHIKVFDDLGIEEWGTVEYEARKLALATQNSFIRKHPSINFQGCEEDTREVNIPISRLWYILLHNLLNIFPEAIMKATSLSREQEEGGKSKGYKVDE